MKELSLQEMKKISHEIINNEEKKYNIHIKVFPLTFVQYYNKYVFNKKYSLKNKIKLSFVPLFAGGFSDMKGNTIIFLNHINNIEKIENKVFRIAEVCFHEARHIEQLKFDDYSYEGFFIKIDRYLKNIYFNDDYIINHDKYSFEIGANLYGILKAKEYLKENYFDLYKEYESEINEKEQKYKYDYLVYDATNNIDRFMQTINIKLDDKFRNNIDKKLPSTLSIFLDDKKMLRNIKEIINNPKFQTLDKRIIYAFFSSQFFLKQINFNYLTKEEIKIVKEAVEYTNTIHRNQYKIIEKLESKNIKTKKSSLAKLIYDEKHNSNNIYINKKNINLDTVEEYLKNIDLNFHK